MNGKIILLVEDNPDDVTVTMRTYALMSEQIWFRWLFSLPREKNRMIPNKYESGSTTACESLSKRGFE